MIYGESIVYFDECVVCIGAVQTGLFRGGVPLESWAAIGGGGKLAVALPRARPGKLYPREFGGSLHEGHRRAHVHSNTRPHQAGIKSGLNQV